LLVAEDELTRPEEKDLFGCILNQAQVHELLMDPKKKFKGESGAILAAITLQKAWKRHKAYTDYNQLRFLMAKATIIQRKYRLYCLQKSTKAKIERFNEESMVEWRNMM